MATREELTNKIFLITNALGPAHVGLTHVAESVTTAISYADDARGEAEGMQTEAYGTGYLDKGQQLGVVIDRLNETVVSLGGVLQQIHADQTSIEAAQAITHDAQAETERLSGQ